ncbi:MAG: alpha-amylase [Chloroflexi bacterium AL-W]|nr:alpha-amylase [Chloroflexi bacterium AL-N1]NOK66617.1 alpha-amylase [Chloroflexi bacterium AL-N10]NOK72005.1 alpha-amylase [Chloroflexi bacterium AL-N5]NOK81262.1 alpha-amylase [Chloroflexi bacterium AL-W]NOK89535.1 alpha-amylase [Chloroflexi bacterium AL-N15]
MVEYDAIHTYYNDLSGHIQAVVKVYSAMPTFTVQQDRHSIIVHTPHIDIGFSQEHGGLYLLRTKHRPNVLSHGPSFPALDVQVGLDAIWLAQRTFVRYLNHTITERNDTIDIAIMIGIGPLIVYDRYHIVGTLITRRVSVKNVSEDEVQLHAVRLALPWACIGEPEACRFEAPGHRIHPHTTVNITLPPADPKIPHFFKPTTIDQWALEQAPIVTSGLIALHNPLLPQTLLCWYHSEVEPATPSIDGNRTGLTLTHELMLADRLNTEIALNGGTQYILLLEQPWDEALKVFQQSHGDTRRYTPIEPTSWVRDAAIYEVYPAHFDGFRGLAAQLPHLQALGINTLCMLPIWTFDNPHQQLWDENWTCRSNPYAISHFGTIEPTLGTPDDIRYLVEQAHAHSMRVVVDLPLIGCSQESPYVVEHPEWFCQNEDGTFLHSSEVVGSYCFDWTNTDLRNHVIEQAQQQLVAYDFDGYRAMVPRTPPINWASHISHHASTSSLAVIAMLRELRQALTNAKLDMILFTPFGGPIYDSIADLAIDEPVHHQFFRTALGSLAPEELGQWLYDLRTSLPPDTIRACFVESYYSHQVNAISNGMRGSRISRLLLAGMVFCGFVPLIRAGQEDIDDAFITRLFHVRATHSALRYGTVHYNAIMSDNPDIFGILSENQHECLLCLLNMGPDRHTITIQIPTNITDTLNTACTLTELLRDIQWNEAGQTIWSRTDIPILQLTLAPFEAYCFHIKPVTNSGIRRNHRANKATRQASVQPTQEKKLTETPLSLLEARYPTSGEQKG